jgi:hypothetical protein
LLNAVLDVLNSKSEFAIEKSAVAVLPNQSLKVALRVTGVLPEGQYQPPALADQVELVQLCAMLLSVKK